MKFDLHFRWTMVVVLLLTKSTKILADQPDLQPPYGSNVEVSLPHVTATYPSTPYPPLVFPPPISRATVAAPEFIPISEPTEVVPTPSANPTEKSMLLKQPEEHAPAWYSYPTRWIDTIPWDTGIELGVNGSTGNNEAVSVRTGGYIRRESEFARININTYYNKTSAGGVETQSNGQLNISNDWLFHMESPWTLFTTSTLFYDEFQAFDIQTNMDGGIGYRLINDEHLALTTRMGAGSSREFGGPNDEWVAEAIFSLVYEHQISTRQRIYTTLDYFPELERFDEFRLVTDLGWEIELEQPANLSLKISLTDRYDSTLVDTDPRLMNYSVLLLWKI